MRQAAQDDEDGPYLSPSEVARELHVSPKTIARWADQGLVPCIVTLGGHRRFRRADVVEIARRMNHTTATRVSREE